MTVPMSQIKQYLSAGSIDKRKAGTGSDGLADAHVHQPQPEREFIKQLMSSLISSSDISSIDSFDAERNKLTRREQQILTLIMAGLSNKRIGQKLDICEGTVKVHVKNLMRKLHVSSRYEAALVSLADVLDR